MNFQCPKCTFNGHPHLSETGPHTKATCPDCGAYIKMVSRDELDAIVTASNLAWTKEDVVDASAVETTLVIKTMAPADYHPEILNRVKKSLENGFTSGNGRISRVFDETYNYDFYYE